jgi:hypothetical protein
LTVSGPEEVGQGREGGEAEEQDSEAFEEAERKSGKEKVTSASLSKLCK